MVSAQWQKGNEKVEDTPERKSVNGFGGHLIIVEDPKGFIEEWSKPDTPNIKPVTDVKRGVIRPDGDVYAERKEQPLWKVQAPPAQNIQLSRAILGIRIEPKDPSGEYKVRAKVSDRNAALPLSSKPHFE